MKRFFKVLFPLSVGLFVLGIAVGFLGRIICTRDNKNNYQVTQAESFVPDTIQTVLHDEALGQIYVCYNDSNCVNAYTVSGAFLWCVSTPYMRNSEFGLQDGKLIIYDVDAYIYDAQTGAFLEKDKEENLNLDYQGEKEYTGQYEEGAFYYDQFQVYRATADGVLETVVSRPWWYALFSFGLTLTITFIGAIGIGISLFEEKRRDYTAAKKTAVILDKKGLFTKNYFMITAIVQIVYTVLNISLAFFTTWLIIGIMPIAVHLIVSSWILWNMKDHLQCKREEMQIIDFWGAMELGSFIAAFLSVIVAAMIAG